MSCTLRLSRCFLWPICWNNWNIPCILCQRGLKVSVIYSNRPWEWCFYPRHLWLRPLLIFFNQRPQICVILDHPPRDHQSRGLQHLELTVCLLYNFWRGPGVLVVPCSEPRTDQMAVQVPPSIYTSISIWNAFKWFIDEIPYKEQTMFNKQIVLI